MTVSSVNEGKGILFFLRAINTFVFKVCPDLRNNIAPEIVDLEVKNIRPLPN
jgi:hypothetical protein